MEVAKQATGEWIELLERDDVATQLIGRLEMELPDGARAEKAWSERALGTIGLALARYGAARGQAEAHALIDAVLERWERFAPEARTQRHLFLQNALAVVDPRHASAPRLVACVGKDAPLAVVVNLACLHALAGDREQLAKAVTRALDAGATPAQLRHDSELAPALRDPAIAHLLIARAAVAPTVAPAALAREEKRLEPLVARLRKAVAEAETGAPAPRDAIERAARCSPAGFPADYQALLAVIDGGRFGTALAILGTRDWLDETELFRRARAYQDDRARAGSPAPLAWTPIANLGRPDEWVFHDPRRQRYQYGLGADWADLPDLAAALSRTLRALE